MSFREDYLKFGQPSPAREEFVYKAITGLSRDSIVKSMKPITVKRPDGTKIIYKVMPDYLMVEGIRIPMAGNTAQKVADYFDLVLPNATIAKEIYQNSDVKVTANPLSYSGANIDNKQYSGSDVVNKGVGYAPFALHYNDKVNEQLADKGVKPGSGQIVSGFAKDIVSPAAPGKLGLYGLYDASGKPIQGGSGQTPHNTSTHTEYGSFVRLIYPDAVVIYPDGHQENKPIESVYDIARYLPKESPAKYIAKYTPDKPQSGRALLLKRVDEMLKTLAKKL
jgi:hypothetical protein